MSARGCPPGDRLSAFLDGDLPAAEAHTVGTHLAGCAACTRAVAELGALVGVARALDRPEPPPTLWPVIAQAIDETIEKPARGWLSLRLSWRPFGAGALAGAAAVVAVVLLLRGGARPLALAPAEPRARTVAAAAPVDPMLEEAEAEFARAAAQYERSIDKLRGLLEREKAGWTPDEQSRYAERLARLDDAILRSREAVRRSVGDAAGNEQLFAAYQQKIAFLSAAVHRGGAFGESAP